MRKDKSELQSIEAGQLQQVVGGASRPLAPRPNGGPVGLPEPMGLPVGLPEPMGLPVGLPI